ncbi:MAG: HAMP domain-containing histidine kinase [Lachnospiraceae bacterium]|nr:HAMP domain-containing histidine kinase [Lachnospiraceae bacterium]
MSKVRKQFIIYAMVAVFVLLTALLGIINGINFTKVAEDADRVTQMIAEKNGDLNRGQNAAFSQPIGKTANPFAPNAVGPDSPELPYSARYFTIRYLENGTPEIIAYNVAAFTKEEAKKITDSLKDEGKGKTGWVNSTYRYRVYREGKATYVTVLDQGREMAPSYRILWISIIGEAAGLAACLVFLIFISRRLFKPLEEADRKQRQFMAEAENEFKIPLTVIEANAEVLEKENGPSESTQSIRRQVRKMTALTKKIGTLSVLEENAAQAVDVDLSKLFANVLQRYQASFEEAGLTVETDIADGILVRSDPEAMQKLFEETAQNALKFAESFVRFALQDENGKIRLTVQNGTSLPNGKTEQVFDRFVRLENAAGKEGNGLGLSYVKDIVSERNGRVMAEVKDSVFILQITL